MDGGSFRVVLEARIREGEDPGRAKLRLAKLFKREPSRVDALLRGAPRIIKGGLDYATAQRYKAAVERAGGVCRVEQTPAEQEELLRAAVTRSAMEGGGEASRAVPVCSHCGQPLPAPAPPPCHPRPAGSLWRRT